MITEWVEDKISLYAKFGKHRFLIGYFGKTDEGFKSQTKYGETIHKSETEARVFIEKKVPKSKPVWFVDHSFRAEWIELARIEESYIFERFYAYIYSVDASGDNCWTFNTKREAWEFIEKELA